MGAEQAVDFLSKDHGDIEKGSGSLSGFRRAFAEDDPYKSILQRNGKTLDDVLGIFDWHDDDAAWSAEYDSKSKNSDKMMRLKRRIAFEICGWREFNEDFGRGDVSCLRDLRTPLVTSRSPLKAMKDEFRIGKVG